MNQSDRERASRHESTVAFRRSTTVSFPIRLRLLVGKGTDAHVRYNSVVHTCIVKDAVLETIDSDLQMIVHCTTERGTPLFDVLDISHPSDQSSSRGTWRSARRRIRLDEMTHPHRRASRKETITCPRDGGRSFLSSEPISLGVKAQHSSILCV